MKYKKTGKYKEKGPPGKLCEFFYPYIVSHTFKVGICLSIYIYIYIVYIYFIIIIIIYIYIYTYNLGVVKGFRARKK